MEEHRNILERAESGDLPGKLDERSSIPVQVVRELVEAGYLSALDASSMDGLAYVEPRITLAGRRFLKTLREEDKIPHSELVRGLEQMRDMLTAVATGGPRIDRVNDEYRALYARVDQLLSEIGIQNPIPFPDLWTWYGRWSDGDLPSYQSRREFLSEMFVPLIRQVRQHAAGQVPDRLEPTGWPKVDRQVGEVRRRLAEAAAEEQFQAVGLLCREVLISLGQAVYDPELHPSLDGVEPSKTDAKKQLGNYIRVALGGSSHEVARKHARAAVDLAVELQHRRTADFRQAALCVEATGSVVNVIAIVSGRRDPS